MKNEPARRRLARIRCLLESINRIEQGKCFPLPLCFVPAEVEYSREDTKNSPAIAIRKKPQNDAQSVGELPSVSNLQLFASGEEFFNNNGSWIKLCQVVQNVLHIEVICNRFVNYISVLKHLPITFLFRKYLIPVPN